MVGFVVVAEWASSDRRRRGEARGGRQRELNYEAGLGFFVLVCRRGVEAPDTVDWELLEHRGHRCRRAPWGRHWATSSCLNHISKIRKARICKMQPLLRCDSVWLLLYQLTFTEFGFGLHRFFTHLVCSSENLWWCIRLNRLSSSISKPETVDALRIQWSPMSEFSHFMASAWNSLMDSIPSLNEVLWSLLLLLLCQRRCIRRFSWAKALWRFLSPVDLSRRQFVKTIFH